MKGVKCDKHNPFPPSYRCNNNSLLLTLNWEDKIGKCVSSDRYLWHLSRCLIWPRHSFTGVTENLCSQVYERFRLGGHVLCLNWILHIQTLPKKQCHETIPLCHCVVTRNKWHSITPLNPFQSLPSLPSLSPSSLRGLIAKWVTCDRDRVEKCITNNNTLHTPTHHHHPSKCYHQVHCYSISQTETPTSVITK